MADLAAERRMLLDDSVVDGSGNKIFKVLPWESVVYTNGAEKTAGLEMVSVGLGSATKDNGTDRQIRGIDFISVHKFYRFTNSGGTNALPIA